jgi:glutathionyl-hydroquinone reductase
MGYILDDRLWGKSIFYDIIANNKLNFSLFLKDAHKAKKPDRLRQYITEDCPYAHKTVLLHAGR